jgi:hypothetical protein
MTQPYHFSYVLEAYTRHEIPITALMDYYDAKRYFDSYGMRIKFYLALISNKWYNI